MARLRWSSMITLLSTQCNQTELNEIKTCKKDYHSMLLNTICFYNHHKYFDRHITQNLKKIQFVKETSKSALSEQQQSEVIEFQTIMICDPYGMAIHTQVEGGRGALPPPPKGQGFSDIEKKTEGQMDNLLLVAPQIF